MRVVMERESLLLVIIEELKKFDIDQMVDLTLENASDITFGELRIDSLETIQLGLDLEKATNIKFSIHDFPQDATLIELADYLIGIKNQTMKN